MPSPTPIATALPTSASPSPTAGPTQDLRLGGLERPWTPSLDDFDWRTGRPVVVPVPVEADEAEDAPESPEAAVGASATAQASGSVSTLNPVDLISGAAARAEAAAQATGFGALGQSGLIAFSSDRKGGGGYGADVFVYDHAVGTVLALPGVNTGDDEINPRISANGRWLIYATDVSGNFDIYLYDTETSLIDTLPTLNTDWDEVAPSIDDAGNRIAFAFERYGDWVLGVHEVPTGRTLVPTAVAALGDDIRTPWISGDGRYVAFCADVDGMGLDVFLYSFETAALVNPPFVNSEDDEFEPALSQDGTLLTYVSDRAGSDDIYLADLTSGFTDRLIMANSADDERSPRFLGNSEDTLVFNSDRTGDRQLYLYHLGTGIIDLLPIAHEIGADDEMLDQSSSTAGAGGGGLWGGRLGGGLRGVRSGIGHWW